MFERSSKKRHAKVIAIILIDILIIASLIIYFGVIRPNHSANIKINGVFIDSPNAIADFKFINNKGKVFNKDSLKGHWTMMFFGFTNCAMVCPTTMDSLNKMYKMLQKDLPADKLPQIVFVSVDPDRDTIERLDDYMKAFNKNFIGIRAEIPETIALEKQFHIAAAKMEVDGEGANHYTINHSAEILLLNPNAQVQAYFSYPHEPEKMATDYKLILKTLKG